MSDSSERLALSFFLVTSVWSLALALLGAHEAMLFLAPALLLALPLASGRYLGEEQLARARERRDRPRRRGLAPELPAADRPSLPLPRGGGLIAFALASRPPPALALH